MTWHNKIPEGATWWHRPPHLFGRGGDRPHRRLWPPFSISPQDASFELWNAALIGLSYWKCTAWGQAAAAKTSATELAEYNNLPRQPSDNKNYRGTCDNMKRSCLCNYRILYWTEKRPLMRRYCGFIIGIVFIWRSLSREREAVYGTSIIRLCELCASWVNMGIYYCDGASEWISLILYSLHTSVTLNGPWS